MVVRWRKVASTLSALRDYRHELRVHPTCAAFLSYMMLIGDLSANQANKLGASPELRRIRRSADAALHVEAHGLGHVFDHRLDPGLLSFLRREPEGAYERHLCPAGRIWAGHGSGPEPGDH